MAWSLGVLSGGREGGAHQEQPPGGWKAHPWMLDMVSTVQLPWEPTPPPNSSPPGSLCGAAPRGHPEL